ncbi:MAG: hypothetical protein H7301_11115 [Cryobacterium sp.]|nr:hypothetical protein [Oligoflexia bacterium]
MSRLRVQWSFLYSEPHFKDIHNVVVENPVNSDSTRMGNVDTHYPATFGQSIGFSVQSKDRLRKWGLGAVMYLPLDRLALIDSGESFVPEYTLHRGSTHKPEFEVAFSGRLSSEFALGAGIHFGAKLDSNTSVFLNQGAGTSSSMRISAGLKTQASPYFGLSYVPSDTLSLGLTFRTASPQAQTLQVQSSARAIGTVSALDFSFPALSTLYYDPLSLELGTEWKYSSQAVIYAQVDYQAWSKFESPNITILDPQTSTCAPNCGVKFSEGRNLSGQTRDTFIPRIGHVWKTLNGSFLTGYTYRPSIYRSLPTEAGNAIDPDEHRFSAGYGFGFDSLLVFDAPGRLNFHAAYSIYPKRSVQKTSGDESGNAANLKVGAPGYDIGGSEWGGGLTLELAL